MSSFEPLKEPQQDLVARQPWLPSLGVEGVSDLLIAKGSAVISTAQKFIIPVPRFTTRGAPLVHPDGEKKDQPLLDYSGHEKGSSGVLWKNPKDQSYQAVTGRGDEVIIINQVTPERGKEIAESFNRQVLQAYPISAEQFQSFINSLKTELGFQDIYDSNLDFVRSKLTPVNAESGKAILLGAEARPLGLFKRDVRDICHAVYIAEPFEFLGPAASPQKFPNGGVLVKVGATVHGVQPEIFEQTYRVASDGGSIYLRDPARSINCYTFVALAGLLGADTWDKMKMPPPQ